MRKYLVHMVVIVVVVTAVLAALPSGEEWLIKNSSQDKQLVKSLVLRTMIERYEEKLGKLPPTEWTVAERGYLLQTLEELNAKIKELEPQSRIGRLFSNRKLQEAVVLELTKIELGYQDARFYAGPRDAAALIEQGKVLDERKAVEKALSQMRLSPEDQTTVSHATVEVFADWVRYCRIDQNQGGAVKPEASSSTALADSHL